MAGALRTAFALALLVAGDSASEVWIKPPPGFNTSSVAG
jgi:hypothetical protein